MQVQGGCQRSVRYGLSMVSTALAALWLISGAQAQDRHSPQTVAQEQQSTFDIPPQPLIDALALFGRQSGMQVSVDAGLIRDIRSAGVRGAMSPEQALRQILAGTGVNYRLTDANTAILKSQMAEKEDDGAIVLNPITVEGQSESAYGPVEGYKASRSATATKTGAPIVDTPAAVQVIPADVIKDQGARRMEDVLRNVAGAYDLDNDLNVASQNAFNIRGFAVRDIFKDGMRLTESGQQVLSNVERVEVLKGPASLLYGSLEPGGMINIVTKKPLPAPQYQVELGVGSFGYVNPVVDATGPLGSDKILYRFIGSYAHSNTFVDNGDDDRFLLAPSLMLLPTEDLTINASFEWTRVDRRPIFFTPIVDGGPDPRFDLNADYQADFAFKETEEMFAKLGFEYDFAESTRANLNLSWKRRTLDESMLRFFFGPEQPGGVRDRFYSFRDQENDQYVAEGNLIHEFSLGSTEHTLLFGGDFRRFEDDYRAVNITGGFPAPIAGPGNADVPEPTLSTPPIPLVSELEESGVYIQDDVWLFDQRLKLVGTLRYTRINNISGDQIDDKVTPRIGALYKLTPDTSAYVSYATSFEPVTGTDRQGAAFVPSEGEQYEAGIKQEFFNGQAAATLSVYQITQTNVTTPDPVDPNFRVQTGEVRSRGVELDVSGQLLDRLNIYAAAAYIDNEITKTNVVGQKGNRNPEVPTFKGSLWLTYDLYRNAEETLTIGGGVFGETSNYVSTDNNAKLPGYVTVDLGAWYDFKLAGKDLTAQLNVTNLLNKDHFVGGFSLAAQRGQPRTVLGRISVKF